DMLLVKRVGFDSIPSLRWQLLQSLINGVSSVQDDFKRATLAYVREDLKLLGLLDGSFQLSKRTLGLFDRLGQNLSSLTNHPERELKRKESKHHKGSVLA